MFHPLVLLFSEIIKLVNCIIKNDKGFQPLLSDCGEEHMQELVTKLGHSSEEVDAAEICRSVSILARSNDTAFISLEFNTLNYGI